MPTKPYTPSEAAPVRVSFVPPPVPRFPRPAALSVQFWIALVPVDAATPMPAGVIDTTGVEVAP